MLDGVFQVFTRLFLWFMRHTSSLGNTDHRHARATAGREVVPGRDWPGRTEEGQISLHWGYLGGNGNHKELFCICILQKQKSKLCKMQN